MKYILMLVILLFSFNALADDTSLARKFENLGICAVETMTDAEREFYVRSHNANDEEKKEMRQALTSLLRRVNNECDNEAVFLIRISYLVASRGDFQSQMFFQNATNLYTNTVKRELSDLGYIFRENSSLRTSESEA